MQKSIIFIHGNSGSAQDWNGVIDVLGPQFRCICLNLLGSFNNLADNYSLAALCEDSIDQINRFGINDYVLVGHSLGGHVAHQIAPRIKQTCRHLISFGAPPLSHSSLKNSPFHASKNAQVFSNKEVDEELLKGAFFENFNDGTYSYASFLATYEKSDGKFRSQVFESVMKGQFQDEIIALRASGIPVSFLLSEQDPYINQAYVVEASKNIINSDSMTSLENCHHYPHIENPSLTAQKIKQTLEKAETKSKGRTNGKQNQHARYSQEDAQNL